MVKSMTGFGNSVCVYDNAVISIEIKAVNSKGFDFLQKIPSVLKDNEFDIRTIVSKALERGKIDLNITIDNGQEFLENTIDKNKVKAYYGELENIASEMGITLDNSSAILAAILRMPDIMTSPKNVISTQLWQEIEREIHIACELLDKSRLQEGITMEKDFELRIALIQEYLQKVEPFEKQRIDVVKNRIYKQLNDLSQPYDEGRLEQELIFYLEKLDITEEKVRLAKHCEYFLQTMNENISNGKKLTFISQEIGREINTLGSKANDVDIQKLVVQMKDELEKIKEQLSNVL